jgi:hypothetical protein
MMKKILGLALAVGLLSQTANAALLATWNFNTNASGTVATGATGSVTDFVNFGTNGSEGVNGSRSANAGVGGTGGWQTASNITTDASGITGTRYNKFTFTNTGTGPYLLDQLDFSIKRVGGSGFLSVSAAVTYVIGGVESDPVASASSNSSATFNSSNNPLSVILGAGQTVEFRFYYYRGSNGTPGIGAVVDDIKVYGGTVPEPTSLAVFALVGGGLVARRIRRKV